MAVRVIHSTVTGAAPDLTALVDGPKWDADHTVTGLENVDNTADATKTVANSNNAAVANDVTTSATMYPVWVTANAGNLPLKVSSTILTFNPSSATFNIAGALQVTGAAAGFNLKDRGGVATNDWTFYSQASAFRVYNNSDGIDWLTVAKVTGLATFAGGAVSSNATAGIGYATGAGGTVTQATSKSTTVPLNKATGLITMNAAALAAATIVSFALTDSAIAATDQIMVSHESGGTLGAYTVNGRATGVGAGAIDIRNNTAGSLSEAIVLRFSIIKSVNA